MNVLSRFSDQIESAEWLNFQKKKPRLTKDDIGHPTNFQHKVHVGRDSNGGFSQNYCECQPLDDNVKKLLRVTGDSSPNKDQHDINCSSRRLRPDRPDLGRMDDLPPIPPVVPRRIPVDLPSARLNLQSHISTPSVKSTSSSNTSDDDYCYLLTYEAPIRSRDHLP